MLSQTHTHDSTNYLVPSPKHSKCIPCKASNIAFQSRYRKYEVM